MAWAKNGTPDTLGSAGGAVTISDLTATKFNVIMCHLLQNGAIDQKFIIDGLTTSTYAQRKSNNGGSDTTSVSRANIDWGHGGVANDQFYIAYGINISSEEKLFMAWSMGANTAGASNAPVRTEGTGKQSGTSSAFTQIETNDNGGSGTDIGTSSNLSALGADVTEEAILGNNVQSGSRFEATDTRKIYYRVLASVTFEEEYTSNTGWTQVGSLVTVNSHVTGKVAVNNAGTNAEHRVYKSIGTTLNDTKWFCDFDLWVDSGTSTSFPLALTSGTGGTPENSGVNEDVIAVAIDGNKLGIMHRNGSTASYTAFTSISTSTNYYCRLIRDSATQATLKVWTNSNRTGATAISDIVKTNIPSDVVNLAYLQHSTYSQGGGSSGVSWEVDNVDIYNGATSTTDLVWTEEV